MKKQHNAMKNIVKINTRALFLALLLLFCSCQKHPFYDSTEKESGTGNIESDAIIRGRFTADADKIAVFANGVPGGWWARNDRGNGHPFNCSFQRSNAVIDQGFLTLSLTESNGGYVGAEYRTQQKYSYGYYSVSMKSASCSGVISSFFTYTGWPWDEIDIEFLGDDTTRVQFNYFKNGEGGHEYIYYLGFDASKEFHEYGFDWRPNSITWYVDGQSVYQVAVDIPSASGQIMMNLWNVADTNANWAGKFDGTKLPVTAQYQWVGYKSAG